MDAELNTILGFSEQGIINKNDYFIKVGQINRRLGVVRKGILRGFVVDDKGCEINIILYQENDMVAGNFVADVPATINVQAIENCIIDVANFADVMSTAKDDEILSKLFNEGVNMFHSKIQSRLTSFINYDSLERYRYFLREYPNLINRIPNYHIANFLGITPTQLSRVRKSFANK